MDNEKHNQFLSDLSKLSVADLKAKLEVNLKPCWETELLQVVFPELDMVGKDTLQLYKAHFLLFHALYKLKDEYAEENRYLHIHFMRIHLVDYPQNSGCTFYDEVTGTFCNVQECEQPNYCDFHKSKIEVKALDTLSDKFFYQDEANYFALQEENAERFINGAWELLNNYDIYKESCVIMDLPEGSDIKIVKKRFRHLAHKFHPDIAPENHALFSKINTAYRNILKLGTIKKI